MTLGGLDAAALARVVGGSGNLPVTLGGGGEVFVTTSAHSLSGSRKC